MQATEAGPVRQLQQSFHAALALLTLDIAATHIVGYSVLFDFLELTYDEVRILYIVASLIEIWSLIQVVGYG